MKQSLSLFFIAILIVLTEWASRAFLKPFINTLLMINVLAVQLDTLFTILEFTIAYCAELFLLIFGVGKTLQFFYLLLRKTRLLLMLPSHDDIQLIYHIK